VGRAKGKEGRRKPCCSRGGIARGIESGISDGGPLLKKDRRSIHTVRMEGGFWHEKDERPIRKER